MYLSCFIQPLEKVEPKQLLEKVAQKYLAPPFLKVEKGGKGGFIKKNELKIKYIK